MCSCNWWVWMTNLGTDNVSKRQEHLHQLGITELLEGMVINWKGMVGRWHIDKVTQWHSDTVVDWHGFTVTQLYGNIWRGNTVTRWHGDTVTRLHHETMTCLHVDTVLTQWPGETVTQWHGDTVTRWHSDTVRMWHGEMCRCVPCYLRKVVDEEVATLRTRDGAAWRGQTLRLCPGKVE